MKHLWPLYLPHSKLDTNFVCRRSLLFENGARSSAGSAIPKLPFTKTGRLGGSNQDLNEENEDDDDDMRQFGVAVAPTTAPSTVASMRSTGGGSISRYSSK